MDSPLLTYLMKISLEINSASELDFLLPNIAKIIGECLDVCSVSIVVIDKENNMIDNYSNNEPYHSLSPAKDDIVSSVVNTGTQYIANQKPVLNNSSKSTIILPLNASGNVLGALCLQDKDTNYFSNGDITLARYMATLCSLAIERHIMRDKMKTHEHLQQLGLLKSSVFHDIANLLSVVDVYISMMEDMAENSSEMFDYIETVKSELKYINILTTDMLDLSKDKIVIHKTAFKIKELIDSLKLHTVAFYKNYDVQIEYKIKYNDVITADKNKLFRVFFNLLHNACEAVTKNGRILFSVKETGKDISFLVMDNGKGIEKKDMDKLFQPFYTSGKDKGSGIGLAIANEIVKAHAGSIHVRSKLGAFTYFLIRIPKNG